MPQRVAIVGAGAVGRSLAWRLARSEPAPHIVLYGPRDLPHAYAGSTAAPAMINVLGEITSRIGTSWAARHMLAIGEQAMRLWPEYRARLNAEIADTGLPRVDLHAGTYVLRRPEAEDEAHNLAALRETLAARGRRFEELDLSRPLRHDIVRPERFAEGIFLPDEMFLNAGKLIDGLGAAVGRRDHVVFRDVEVAQIDGARRALVDAEGNEDRFDAIVLANSFGFSRLADQLGVGGVPLMIPVYGVGMTLPFREGHPYAVRTPTYGSSCGDYAVHYPNHLYVGASAIAHSHRVEITPHLQRALDFFDPDANLNDVSLTGGIRAMSQDTYPVLGQLVPGVHAAAGFYKSGVTLAPYAAELLARAILGEEPLGENLFHPFRNTGEKPPSAGELTDTMVGEVEASGTSSGNRAAIRRFRWLIRPFIRFKAGRTAGRLDDGVYYNSDIIQACIHDPSMIARLNAHRPRDVGLEA